jgi:putative copper resistance protein D
MSADLTLWATLTDSSLSYWGLMAASAKLAVYITSFLSAGLALVLVVLPIQEERIKRPLLWVICVAAILSVAASVWRVMIQAGRLMDDTAFMTDPEIIAISLGGPLGTSTLARMIGLAIILLAVFAPSVRTAAAVLGAASVAASFGLTGHAIRDPQWALLALITLHLMAVSFWFGALLPLYQLSKPGREMREAARLSHRFGQKASIIVPILIAVGVGFAYLLLGSVEAVLTTAYGQMLLVKLAIVALVLGIAALNKLRLVPAMEAEKPGATENFRTSLRWEALVFLMIFAATALLTTSFTVPTS